MTTPCNSLGNITITTHRHHKRRKMYFIGVVSFLAFLGCAFAINSITDTSNTYRTRFRQSHPGFPQYGTSDRELIMETSKDTLTFVSMSDWGIEEQEPQALGIAKALIDSKDDYDFIFAGGDNFYDDGVVDLTDFRWTLTWYLRFDIPTLNLPWLAVLGNHDYRGSIQAQIDYGKSISAGARYWFMPNNYYSLSIKRNTSDCNNEDDIPLKLYFLDTEDVDTDQLSWLRSSLNDNPNGRTNIALGHTHIYSNGLRGDNPWYPAKNLDEAFVEGGVKAFICGHEHDMQYLKRNDIDYFLTGGGGGSLRSKGIFGSKATEIFWSKTFGYAVHKINLDTRVMTTTYHFFDEDGNPSGQEEFVSQY